MVPGEAELVRVEHAARPRVARQPLPVPRPLPRAGMAASNAKPSNTRASHAKKAAAPKLAHQATKKAIPSAMATAIPEKTVEKPAAGGQQPERKLGSSGRVEPAQGASIAAVPPTERAKSEVANSEPAAPPPAKSEIAAPPAAPEVAALPAAAGGPPALAPPAQANSIAAVPPTERPKSEVAKSEVAKSEVAKSEVAAPSPAKSEMAAPPAAPEIAAVPPTESPKPEVATPEVAAPPATADAAPASEARTIQEQVEEATGMADRVTAITLEREQASKSDNPGTEPGAAGATDKTASGPPINPDNLVALVLARPEINTLSDLNNKNIAIEEKQSAASGSVSAALMAAGAAEVQFSQAQSGAIDRLISGEVPAAVLTLASPEAAEWFPDIAGFRIFRVPLSPRARL